MRKVFYSQSDNLTPKGWVLRNEKKNSQIYPTQLGAQCLSALKHKSLISEVYFQITKSKVNLNDYLCKRR